MPKLQTHFEQVSVKSIGKIVAREYQPLKKIGDPTQQAHGDRSEKRVVSIASHSKEAYAYTHPAFDIFQVEADGGVLWLEALATFADAKARIRQLSAGSSCDYIILNERTGDKVTVKFAAGDKV
jgi:hypothetical protein